MTNDITVTTNNSLEMLQALRHTVAPGLTEPEFGLFAEMCRATGLNPALKEIWAIKAGGRLQLMTGINGFLKIANSHPAYDGMEVEFEREGDKIISATVKVYRKDRRFPAVATAFMSEYAKPTPIWKQMPSVMLAKCAKSLAIREAFVQELGGLYTAEEMPGEYAPPREVTIPQEDLIISEKTGRVIGVKVPRPTINADAPKEPTLPETKAPLKESIAEAVSALKNDSESTEAWYYDLSPLKGDKLQAAELYCVANNAVRLTVAHWRAGYALDRLKKYQDKEFRE